MYVETSQNPADITSRGTTWNELICSKLWWHGPEELDQDPENWQKNQPDLKKLSDDDEEMFTLASKTEELIVEVPKLFEMSKLRFFNLSWKFLFKKLFFTLF
uniref:Uncharacterized protein n=1 Tax=Acrobeloides nanus TaxID=290746 RepID=A0A914DM15_9BILA